MSLQTTKGLIYLGAPLGTDQKPSDDVKNLGLQLIKLAPSDVRYTVANDAQQYRYGLYKSNLPAFMKAMDGKKTSLLWTFKGISAEYPELPGFTLPPVVFNFEGRMSDDVRDSHLLSAFPDAVIREVVKSSNGRDKFSYIISDLPLEAGAVLASLPGVNYITPQFDGTICIKSIPYYKLCLRIAHKFLKLHNYPSFEDKDHFDAFEKDRINQPGWKDEAPAEDEDMDREEYHGDKPFSKKEMESFGAWSDRTAKGGAVAPPQTPAESASLNANQIGLGGYFAPFVAPLSLYDEKTVLRVIQDFFYGCLGEEEEEAAETFNDLSGELGSIGKTTQGMALAHLYFCIRLAIQGQLSIKSYNNSNGYAGCIMQGYGTHITIFNREIGYADKDNLKAALMKADVHTRALAQIATLLSADDDMQDTIRGLQSMSALKKFLGEQALNDTLRNSIRPLLKDLFFVNVQSWKINASSFERFFKLLNEAAPLPTDLPIHHTAVFNDDRLYVLLSCFGDYAPTFRCQGGREVPLDTFQASIFDKKAKEKKVVAVNRIGCRTVTLTTAYNDWLLIRSEKTILNPYMQPKAKVSMEHFTRFFDDGAMKAILQGLRTFVGAVAVNAGGPSGKRKEVGDGGEYTDAKRRKKTGLAF